MATNKTHYTFSQSALCFSDIEGSIPDISSLSIEYSVQNQTEFVQVPINPSISVKGIKRENQLITTFTDVLNINNNSHNIIFAGDLIDRGPHSIKLLQKMLNLKETNQDKVMLIMGNRDLNKVRLIDELFICKKTENVPCWIGATNFLDLCRDVSTNFNNNNFKFKFNSKELKIGLISDNTCQAGFKTSDEYVNTQHKITWDDIFVNTLDRVKNVYESTMGCKIYLFIESLITTDLLKKDQVLTDDIKYAAVAIMSMVMGCVWSDAELPKFLQAYNGLYIKYLKASHMIATFQIGTKCGVVSHSGLPWTTDGPVFTNIFSDNILTNILTEGYNISDIFTKDKILQIIEDTKNDYLNELTYKADREKTFRSSVTLGVAKLIQLSLCQNDSPIAHKSMTSLATGGPKAIATSLARKTGKTLGINLPRGATTFYNIFGHQPTGYVPEVSEISEIERLKLRNVCLDISKAEDLDKANKQSIALLHITGSSDDSLIGCVKLNDNKIYNYNYNFDQYLRYQSTSGVLVKNNDNCHVCVSYKGWDKIVNVCKVISGGNRSSKYIDLYNKYRTL